MTRISYRYHINPRTYTQIHTTIEEQGEEWIPPPFLLKFLISDSISKRFCLQWKAFDFLKKLRYILWVLAQLEACDVTNDGCHLGFYQELEIRLKPREMVFVCASNEK